MVVTDKRLDSYNLLMQKSEQQSPYHLIGPLNYHVQWLAFWAFAYIKLIPLKLHICWRTGMFDVANRCKLRHKNFFLTTFLYRVSPPYLLATTTSQEPHPKFKRYFYDYFKTKQQEFIHPLILSPTLHERKKTKIQKKNKFVFHLVLLGQKRYQNWPKINQKKTHTKKLRKTKQQIITLIRIKTYWDFSGFQGAIYQQLSWVCFPTKTSTGTKS